MTGIEKLANIAKSTPRMAQALPGLPMDGTVMVRLIRLASGATTEFFEPHFRAAGIGEGQFHVLCLLVSAPDGRASPSELSDLVGTSRANMTRILEQLEHEGWVSRIRAARDGRRQIVCITPSGRARVDATVPQIADPIVQAFARLDPAELAQLQGLLKKLVLSLDAVPEIGVAAA